MTFSDSSTPAGRAPGPCDHDASAVCSLCISRTCSCSACRPVITCPAWQRRDGVDLEPWDRQPEPPVGAPMDLFAAAMIIDGEQEGDELEAYALMIRTGVGWSLQGRIGRAMASLIDNNIIDRDGNIIDRDVQCTEKDILDFESDGNIDDPVILHGDILTSDCEADTFTIEAVDALAEHERREHPALRELRAMAEDELHMSNERREDWGRGR